MKLVDTNVIDSLLDLCIGELELKMHSMFLLDLRLKRILPKEVEILDAPIE